MNWIELLAGIHDRLAFPWGPRGVSADGRKVVQVVRDGWRIETEPGPTIMRREHEFADLGSFAAWLRKRGNGQATDILFADTSVVAILGPDVEADVVTCSMRAHPRWTAWVHRLGHPLSPTDLYEHLVSSADDVVSENGAKVSTGESLALQLQKIDISTNISMKLDPLGFVKFSGQTDDVQTQGALPPWFEVDVPRFLGVPDKSYRIAIRLRMALHKERGVEFMLTAPRLEVAVEQARLDAMAYLAELLGDEWLVASGSAVTHDLVGRVPVPEVLP